MENDQLLMTATMYNVTVRMRLSKQEKFRQTGELMKHNNSCSKTFNNISSNDAIQRVTFQQSQIV